MDTRLYTAVGKFPYLMFGMLHMWLNRYTTGSFSPGRSIIVQVLWYVLGNPLLQSRLLGFSGFKVWILRCFGARIGSGVVIKPGVRIKFPWRLRLGDSVWLGEDVWLDNLAHITIESHSCISQGCYLCTGNHDWTSAHFDLRVQAITIGMHVWVGARSNIGPGTNLSEGSVIHMGSTFTGQSLRWTIYQGVPAKPIATRPKSIDDRCKNILLVNQNFYPDQSATSQYLTDLALELREAGHCVSVLASRFSYLDRDKLYPQHEDWRGIHIERVGFLANYRTPFFARVISSLSLNLSFALRLRSMRKFDSVVVMTSPPLVALIAQLFMPKPKPRIIYWLMDINPDQSIAAGFLKRDSTLARILSKSLRYVLSRSNHQVVLDRFMKERLLAHGADAKKVDEISLWANTDELKPVPTLQNTFLKEHGLADKFVVMYSGNFSLCHPLYAVIEAAEKLRADPSTMFVFIGDGVEADHLKASVKDRQLSNVLFLPYQDRSRLSESLSGADIHIVSQGENFVGIVHPSKVYGIAAVGKPVLYLGPHQSSVLDQMQALGMDLRFAPKDSEEILQALLAYRNLSAHDKEALQNKIRESALRFDRKKVIPKLIECITERQPAGPPA